MKACVIESGFSFEIRTGVSVNYIQGRAWLELSVLLCPLVIKWAHCGRKNSALLSDV